MVNDGPSGGRRLHLSRPGHIIDPLDSEDDLNLNHEGQFGPLNDMMGYTDEVSNKDINKKYFNVICSQIIVLLSGLVVLGKVQFVTMERNHMKYCAMNYFLNFTQDYQCFKAVLWSNILNNLISTMNINVSVKLDLMPP